MCVRNALHKVMTSIGIIVFIQVANPLRVISAANHFHSEVASMLTIVCTRAADPMYVSFVVEHSLGAVNLRCILELILEQDLMSVTIVRKLSAVRKL